MHMYTTTRDLSYIVETMLKLLAKIVNLFIIITCLEYKNILFRLLNLIFKIKKQIKRQMGSLSVYIKFTQDDASNQLLWYL